MGKTHHGVSRDIRLHIYFRENGRCFWCDIKLNFNNSTSDHIIPHSKGGSKWVGNLVLSCEPCNVERRDMDAEEFLAIKMGNARCSV